MKLLKKLMKNEINIKFLIFFFIITVVIFSFLVIKLGDREKEEYLNNTIKENSTIIEK